MSPKPKPKLYASQTDAFVRAFATRLKDWTIKHKAHPKHDPPVPASEGPGLTHIIGTLLAYNCSEAKFGNSAMAKHWAMFKEANPGVAHLMLRSVAEMVTTDGRRFELVDYEAEEQSEWTLCVGIWEGGRKRSRRGRGRVNSGRQ